MVGDFRPPLLKKIERTADSFRESESHSEDRPAKRPRLSSPGEIDEQHSNAASSKRPDVATSVRKPLLSIKNPVTISKVAPGNAGIDGCYNVLWRKFSNKKHKTWDGDGVLRVSNDIAYLQDVSGKEMGKSPLDSPLLPGSIIAIGGKEVEVDSIMAKTDIPTYLPPQGSKETTKIPEFKKIVVPEDLRVQPKKFIMPPSIDESLKIRPLRPMGTSSQSTHSAFKNPVLNAASLPKASTKEVAPRHDPTTPGAIVMKRPKICPKDRQIVDVVVDPVITRHLRDHQREGVKFLYECVMGLREDHIRGAILADEMGLGKTLQTIALIWTLLKQNPIAEESPVVKKALIVCPVTLINNWRKEFRKWLGNDRLGVYVFDDTKKRITDFTRGKAYNVMIIGYEKLRTVHEELKKGHSIDIVVADEGHRLKTAKNKSALAIKNLDTDMRVILSGTPIQNDLSEFYMMVDFVNPSLLGSYQTFMKDFGTPILKSRQPGALQKDLDRGEGTSEELASLTSKFILRRSSEILSKYLPAKTEYVLLCQPTSAQAALYRYLLACPAFQSVLGSPETALQLITLLKKVCNSPYLLNPKASVDEATPMNTVTESVLSSIPPKMLRNNQSSTKLRLLDQLLHTLRTKTSEKIVLVSNYTATLDLLEAMVTSLSYPYVRLDGSTPASKRQDIVDTFNRSSVTQCFAFLLSAKSGGVGLNLIGASRLVLFEVDWNPATDLQAMARIHRDGQKRPCVIYRFLMAGAMDEKIWQRQVTKLGLASNIMDQKAGVSRFSREELRDLFRLHESQSCQTHDLINCSCGGRGLPDFGADDEIENKGAESEEDLPDVAELISANRVDMEAQERKIAERKKGGSKAQMDLLLEYSHIDTSRFSQEDNENMEALISDDILLDVLKDEENRVSFAFAKTSA